MHSLASASDANCTYLGKTTSSPVFKGLAGVVDSNRARLYLTVLSANFFELFVSHVGRYVVDEDVCFWLEAVRQTESTR